MYPYKKLIVASFIVVPIMGISVFLPKFGDPFMEVLTITFGMLCIWFLNVGLLTVLKGIKWGYVIRYAISISLVLLFSVFLHSYFRPHLPPENNVLHHPLPLKKDYGMPFPIFPILHDLLNNLIILFIFDLIILREREQIILKENMQLKLRSIEAQQLKLKQQIQPHFLFNSLNTLKSLIRNYPDEAEDYLVKLSRFLRFNINGDIEDSILLEEELKICTDYLEIQKVRFKESLQYSIDIPNEIAHTYKTPVFAIQLLIENAIKHNVLTEEYPLQLKIKFLPGNFISVFNVLRLKKNNYHNQGIGLKNLKNRYELLTNKEVEINKTINSFEVIIPLIE